jgi:hypothetical protein
LEEEEKEKAFVKHAEKTENIKKPENIKKIETKISLGSHSIKHPTTTTNSKMRLHPSVLIDNEEYIIEVKNKTNDIKHVYKGKRKVTSVDKINEEGVYDSLWFFNLDVIYINDKIKIKAPRLKRSTNISHTDLQYMLFQESGKEFKLCHAEEDEEEITFYDCDYYEEYVLPNLEKNITNNLTRSVSSSDNLLSSV